MHLIGGLKWFIPPALLITRAHINKCKQTACGYDHIILAGTDQHGNHPLPPSTITTMVNSTSASRGVLFGPSASGGILALAYLLLGAFSLPIRFWEHSLLPIRCSAPNWGTTTSTGPSWRESLRAWFGWLHRAVVGATRATESEARAKILSTRTRVGRPGR